MKRYGLKQIIIVILLLFVCGCERPFSGEEPPLRPLVYTELPPGEETDQVIVEEPEINVAPEDLGYGLFYALIEHDRSGYEDMFIRASALMELVRSKPEDAERQAKEIFQKSELMWKLFVPELASEEPVGGLSSRLRLVDFRLGKGRNLAGKLSVPEADDLVQHWGNELRIELLGSDKVFVIRIPKIVKTRLGWRIAAPIEFDRTLQLYLETGMHLKSDLLTSEHYPMPLEVGNYWKYRVEREYDADLFAETGESGHGVSQQDVTVNEMITDILHREGYWIVSFERTVVDPQKHPEGPQVSHYGWLVSPRSIYPCGRDCRNNVDSVSYLLGYISRQTPIYRFPLEVGNRWGVAGQSVNYSRYEVRSLHREPIVVPSGSFSEVYELFGSIEEGRESRFFVPGIGVIKRIVRGSVGQRNEVLIQHRLIL